MAYSLDDARTWLALYERGMTHEQISLDTGVSAQTIGKWLRKLPEYQPRQAGPVPGSIRVWRTEAPGSTPVKHATLYPSARGHRRRGRY